MTEIEKKINDAKLIGEEKVFEQPSINPDIEKERSEIKEKYQLDNPLSPESLIVRAILPPIDLIDLHSYHELSLNREVAKVLELNHSAKVVCVGLEFVTGGMQKASHKELDGKTYYNLYLINYDSLLFLKKLQPETVAQVNFDFAYIENETLKIVREAHRVLHKGGRINFYIEQDSRQDIVEYIEEIGFSIVENCMDDDGYTHRDKFRYSSEKINIKISAIK